MLLNLLILFVSLGVLGFSADYLIKASVNIARKLAMSEMLIGLTLVSMGTSAPEIAVSVKAALEGSGDLSIGNVIGSNVFNLGFILGLVALISAQKVHKSMLYRDGLFLLAVSFLVLFFVWDYKVVFYEGAILLFLLASYIAYLFIKKEKIEEDIPEKENKPWWMDVGVFVLSLVGLTVSSDFTVSSASYIASYFGVSEWAIGATIVAGGTSLPEIAASVTATIKNKFDISIGNVIGSSIFNSLGVIGISSVISNINLNHGMEILGIAQHNFSQILMIITLAITLVFFRTKWVLSRIEGGVLFLFALLRMIFEIFVGRV